MADRPSMARSAGGRRFPWTFLFLATLFGGGLWLVEQVPQGRYPAADRVRMAVAKVAGWVTPARAETGTAPEAPAAPPATPLRTVVRVVDGDTLVLDAGEKVRLIGINTPETVDPRRPVQWYGKEASERAKAMLQGRRVRLGFDVEKRDRYGRTLAYLWLEDGTFVNLRLVEEGYAFSYPYPPNVAHEAEFRAAERRARERGLGLWSDPEKAKTVLPKSRR